MIRSINKRLLAISAISALILPFFINMSSAVNTESIATAVRLSGTITGGTMPVSDPIFSQMVARIRAGDVRGAAKLAAESKYFAGYLARRLALQMQSPALSAEASADNDATAFIIAHFVGGAGKPGISSLFSENATYLVNVNGTSMHAASLSGAQIAAVNWNTDLVRVDGQKDNSNTTIPAKHVGGYTTLSDRINDKSFAMYGASGGTNLRMIEGIWEVATGLSLMETASTNAPASEAPRFIPEYDPNFFRGQGQPACLSCHGGGMSSISHGYAAVADTFDFDPQNGFTYIASPTVGTMKSLGSDPSKRNANSVCNLSGSTLPTCSPDSKGVGTHQAWDLTIGWGGAVLNTMEWRGPTSGEGLNELGSAIGKAGIVYEFMVKRVAAEVCPGHDFTDSQIKVMASHANPYSSPAGTDDIRTIVAEVAVQPDCL